MTAWRWRLAPAVIGIAVLVPGSGCRDPEVVIRRLLTAEVDSVSREYLRMVGRGELDEAMARLEPVLQTPEARATLEKISALHGELAPDSVRVVAVQSHDRAGARHINVIYEMRYGNDWLLANVESRSGEPHRVVTGVHAYPLPAPLEEVHRFTLRGKGIGNHLMLLFMAASFGFIVFTIVQVVRSPLRTKWRWILLTLVAATQLKLDWTTGRVAYSPIAVVLFGAGIMKTSALTPWILTVGFPVGALLSFTKARAARRDGREQRTSEAEGNQHGNATTEAHSTLLD